MKNIIIRTTLVIVRLREYRNTTYSRFYIVFSLYQSLKKELYKCITFKKVHDRGELVILPDLFILSISFLIHRIKSTTNIQIIFAIKIHRCLVTLLCESKQPFINIINIRYKHIKKSIFS